VFVEPFTRASAVMSEALSMLLPQTAVRLLDIRKQRHCDDDLKLAWDPLTAYSKDTGQLIRHSHCLTAGTST